jgi:TonB family protein
VLVFQTKTSWLRRLTCRIGAALSLIVLLFLSAWIPSVRAQNVPTLRKLIYKAAPKYPRELKQNDIGGIVRLSIVISPNGSVAKVSPVGGNPVLVDAATVAVKQWKYVPSDHQTTTEVQLDFIPH